MKKMKLIKSLGIISALTMPMATALTTITGCSNKNYSELISEMKDSCVQTFIYICKNTRRNLWNEGDAFKYVKKQMNSMGFEPSGYDDWSQLEAVKRMRDNEMSTYETFNGDYGNIWFDIPASEGFDNVPKIILQCHMDSQMMFEDPATHNQWAQEISETGGGGFSPTYNSSDEILSCDPKFVTSLGADGGVGMAILLTIAKYRNQFNHPGLRLLFSAGESEACPEATVDVGGEQVTYPEYSSGFSLLYYDQIQEKPEGESITFWHGTKPFGDSGEYKYISSVSGVIKNTIFVSSSGIHECEVSSAKTIEDPTVKKWNVLNDTLADSTQSATATEHKKGNRISWTEQVKPGWSEETLTKKWMKISVSGLQGGTSSTYINKGQASAINLLFRMLFTGDLDMQLISCSSFPESAYSLATSAEAQVCTCYDESVFQTKLNALLPSIKLLYPNENWDPETGVKFKFECLDNTPGSTRPNYAMSKIQSRDFIRMIGKELYYGPINWFDNGDLQTSQNIGPVKLEITERKDDETPGFFHVDFHVVERSSVKEQLEIFKGLTHSILSDGFSSWFNPTGELDKESWYTSHIAHMANPVWEAPSETKKNYLANAYVDAFNNFKLRNKTANEHAWLEIACAGDIYEKLAIKNPGWSTELYCTMIGPQVEKNHSLEEVLYTDTLASVLETTVYLLDNADTTLPK